MSSHSKALQTAYELGTSRSAPTVKCSPKQCVTASRRLGSSARTVQFDALSTQLRDNWGSQAGFSLRSGLASAPRCQVGLEIGSLSSWLLRLTTSRRAILMKFKRFDSRSCTISAQVVSFIVPTSSRRELELQKAASMSPAE